MAHPESELSILFDLFATGQRMRRLLAEAMVDSPLSPDEYAVYSVVFEVGPLTPTAMASALGLPVTTVLDHVSQMERRGHIAKETNPTDGRSYLVSLTPAGLEVQSVASARFYLVIEPLLANLEVDPGDVRRILAALGEAMDRTREGLPN